MKVRNVSGWDLDVPSAGGMVPADGVLEVAEDEVYGFTQSANWEPADKPATTVHDREEKRVAKAVEGERAAAEGRAAVVEVGETVDPEA